MEVVRGSSPSGPADAEVPHPDSSCLRLRLRLLLLLVLRRRGTHVLAPGSLVSCHIAELGALFLLLLLLLVSELHRATSCLKCVRGAKRVCVRMRAPPGLR